MLANRGPYVRSFSAKIYERTVQRILSNSFCSLVLLVSYLWGGCVSCEQFFMLPGSTGAVRLALDKILLPQLDSRTKPCNFVELLPRVHSEG